MDGQQTLVDPAADGALGLHLSPGPIAIVAALSVDVDVLDEAGLVEVVDLLRRSRSWLDAQTARAVAKLAERRGGPTDETIAMAEAEERTTPGQEPRPWFWERQVLGTRLGLSESEARRLVSTSVALCGTGDGGRLPSTLDALGAGAVGWSHAEALAAKTTRLTDEQAGEVERTVLVDRRARTAWQYARRAGGLADQLAPPARGAHRERSASAHERPDGVVEVRATLDPEGGRVLARAVDAYATPTDPADTRAVSERWADALVEIGRVALDALAADHPARRRPLSPHLTLVADRSLVEPGPGRGPAVMLDGAGCLGPAQIGPAAAERLVCESTVEQIRHRDGRIVAADAGSRAEREKRLPGASLRRTVAIRDRGCRFPGCTRPIGRCRPHHVIFWSRGGPTTMDNLLSLCAEHHRTVHDDGWGLTFDGRTAVFTDPLGRPYASPAPLAEPVAPPCGPIRTEAADSDEADRIEDLRIEARWQDWQQRLDDEPFLMSEWKPAVHRSAGSSPPS